MAFNLLMPKRLALLPLVALLIGAASPPQFLREAKTVSIGGKTEQWSLVWEGRPSSICGPQDVEMAITCPCTGFAYGEMGKLSLVRAAGGREIERMALGPLFGELPESNSDGLAAMQWRPMHDEDFDAGQGASPKFLTQVRQRPGPRVMRMADYDHDGQASEFLVQVSAGPCGHTAYAAVGVSKARPRLHALESTAGQGGPLVMPGAAWQALLSGSGQRRVTVWPCGDHGAEERSELVLSAKSGAITVRQRSYSCPEDGSRERLLSDEPY